MTDGAHDGILRDSDKHVRTTKRELQNSKTYQFVLRSLVLLLYLGKVLLVLVLIRLLRTDVLLLLLRRSRIGGSHLGGGGGRKFSHRDDQLERESNRRSATGGRKWREGE